jgi:chromosome segregation ATPase
MNDYTLLEASRLVGVAVITLRRSITSGRLEVLPRRTDKTPIRVTREALEAAGYSVSMSTQGAEVSTQAAVLTVAVEREKIRQAYDSELSDKAAKIEALEGALADKSSKIEALEAENRAFEVALARAEGALAGAERALNERRSAFDRVNDSLAPLVRQIAAIEGEARSNHDQSDKPRGWWRRGRR